MNKLTRKLLSIALLALTFVCSPVGRAQIIISGNNEGATLPLRCRTTEHSLFWLTGGGSPGLYECTGTNAWTLRLPLGGSTSIVQQAVVDIGPTSNNGPGDQTKGIRNWSASRIKIINAAATGKITRIVDFSIQIGVGSAGYLDPGGAQAPGIFQAMVYGDLFHSYPGLILNSLLLNAAPTIYTKDDLIVPTETVATGFPVLVYTPDNTTADFSGAVFFGDANGPAYQGNPSGELTTGDAHVLITVQYIVLDKLI